MGFRAPGPGRLGMDRFLEVDRAFWALIGRDGLGPAATHDREARGKSVAETLRCRDAPVGGGGKASGRETQNMGIQRITRRLSKLGELGELGVTGVFFVLLEPTLLPLAETGTTTPLSHPLLEPAPVCMVTRWQNKSSDGIWWGTIELSGPTWVAREVCLSV